jgi:hypothetical protein
MRRIKPQLAPQETRDTHSPSWREVLLLVGYLVICLLSVLTVLLPTTENKEERSEHDAGTRMGESDAQSGRTPAK